MTNDSKNKKAPPWPLESMQPSWVRLIRKRTMIETKIVWTEWYAIWVKSSAITIKKWAILQTSTPNCQKTNLGLNDLLVDG